MAVAGSRAGGTATQ